MCNLNDEVNSTMANVLNDLTEFLFGYAEKNFAVIKIFFKDSYYTIIEKDVAISITTFVANVGGILGLCLGLSFVSMFEAVYHCCSYCYYRARMVPK